MGSEGATETSEASRSAAASSATVGRLLVITAAVMWSSSGFFAKSPLFDWSPDERGPLLAFWRAAFASLILALLVRRPRWSWGLIPMSVLFVAMNYTFLTALVRTEASVVIWLQHLAPAWVLIGGRLLFGEPVQRIDLLLIGFCVTGVAVILGDQLRGQDPISVMLGLASGLTYAGVVLSLRRLRDLDPAWLATANHLVTAVAFLPFAIACDQPPHGQQWLYLIAFGMLQMGLPYLLFAIGVKRIPGNQASALCLLEPILVPVWVFVAWGHLVDYQPPQRSTWIGAGLILTGLSIRFVGFELLKRRRSSGASDPSDGRSPRESVSQKSADEADSH
ncbi:MAG TPA: hypothetical protein DCQ98_03975 [Planctomycetaceae bacterium]|nr:hypothetical protein [Planctomycetaceae bacterium]HRF01662.1 EamA family transporter [Pirellulaceae bacterium]